MEPAWRYTDLDSLRASWTEGLFIPMYHAIETPPLRHKWRGLYVEPSKLRAQLRELQATGCPFVSLGEWNRTRACERQIAVTFDDGFRNVFQQGLPVLRELGIPAINYLVADEIGGTNSWDQNVGAKTQPLMDRSEIAEWLAAGNEIGAHTLTHPHLTSISATEARREIFDSKKKLEDLFGRPVVHFCYPYGDWNPRVRDFVGEAGYETATTTGLGVNDASTDRLALHRSLATHRRPFLTALRGVLRGPKAR